MFNARVVFGGSIPVTQLENYTFTSQWIEQQYQVYPSLVPPRYCFYQFVQTIIVDSFADGLNIDIEDELTTDKGTLLTAFVKNVTEYVL